MDRTSVITLKKKLEVTDLAGEKVMVDFESGKYFLLKGAANEIWEILKDGITINEIIDHLVKVYNVEEEECVQAVYDFIKEITRYGIVKVN